MNKKNDWNHTTEANMVELLSEKVTREEMVLAIKAMKSGKQLHILKYMQK